MKLALLNTSIVTSDGSYRLTTISPGDARDMAQAYLHRGEGIESYIGHQSTADMMNKILGIPVPVSRDLFSQQRSQHALVFKLNGRQTVDRELGLEELEAIGYTFKTLYRVA
jgi:hypothetical protein